jgi:DNA-binding Xre family transcriptional regulator
MWGLYNVDIRSKRERKKDKKMETIKITKNTSAVVNNGKVIYLIQNGIKTQDPLKVRYFQRMI